MGKHRQLLLRILTLVIVPVLAVGVLELALRITGTQSDFFFQPDPEVGGTHIPGKEGWLSFAHGRQYIRINSHGYRDFERQLAKPTGTLRVAVLGDSFVEAFQVALEESFTALLERSLHQICTPPAAVEVLNFGVSGFGTAQELETLRTRALKFDPDLVLLFFYPSNDLFDNSRELAVEPNRLYYELDSEGELVKLPFEISDWPLKRWLRHHSKAYLFVRERLKRVRALRRALVKMRLAQDELPPEARQDRERSLRLQNSPYLVERPPAVTRAWRLTAALLEATRTLAEESGAAFGLVIIPNKEEILDSSGNEDGLDFQQSLSEIREICSRLEMDCLQLVDAFRRSELEIEQLYFPRDGHWTAAGHAEVAKEVSSWVQPRVCS